MLPIHHKVKVKAVVLNQDLARLLSTLEKDKTSEEGDIHGDVIEESGQVLFTVLGLWKAMDDAYPDYDLLDLRDYMRIFYKETKNESS